MYWDDGLAADSQALREWPFLQGGFKCKFSSNPYLGPLREGPPLPRAL